MDLGHSKMKSIRLSLPQFPLQETMYSNTRLWSADSSPCPEREECEVEATTEKQDPCKPNSSPEYEGSRHTSNSGNFSSSAQSNNNSPYYPSCGSYSYPSCNTRCPTETRPFYVSGNRSPDEQCEVMDVRKARAAKRCRDKLMNSRTVKIKGALMTSFLIILFILLASYWINFNKSGEVLALMVLLMVTVVVQKPTIFLPDLIWNS